MQQTTDIWTTIEEYLGAERLELDDLEMLGRGRGRTVRVLVDGDDVDVDRLADLSRGISRLLDEVPDLQDSYQLEVSSPGLERKLRRPRHFEKSVGREVKVKTSSVTTNGVLTKAGEETFTVENEAGESLQIRYADVTQAKTVFRWEKAPKPGH